VAHPGDLPIEVAPDDPQLPQLVTDYVAGMTDRFAIATFEELFVPRTWTES
jgi:dGTPase